MWVIRFPYPATTPSPSPSPVFQSLLRDLWCVELLLFLMSLRLGIFYHTAFLYANFFQCQILFQLYVTGLASRTPEFHLLGEPLCYRKKVRAGNLEIHNAKIHLKMWSVSSASWKCLSKLFFYSKSFKINKFIGPDLRACGQATLLKLFTLLSLLWGFAPILVDLILNNDNFSDIISNKLQRMDIVSPLPFGQLCEAKQTYVLKCVHMTAKVILCSHF